MFNVCVCVLMYIGHGIIYAYENGPEGESVCLSWGIMFDFLVIQGHQNILVLSHTATWQ